MKSSVASQLLVQIQENTTKYLEYLESQHLPEPSWEAGDGLDPRNPPPSDIATSRDAALEATFELHQLLLGPLGLILSSSGSHYLLLSLQYIYRYDIANHVPLGETEEITFEEISKKCRINSNDVKRFLRVAIGFHVFKEPKKGFVVHTAASRLLVGNTMLKAWLLNIADEFWPSLTRTVDATVKWPGSEEPNESGYSLSHNTDQNPFDVIKKDPIRQQQFIDAMSYSHLEPALHLSYLVDNFDFGSIGKGTIVDVGGSHAQVSIAIARKYPEVKCIVQDLPDTIVGLDNRLPEDVKDRIHGMEYDFLTPQPVKGAEIYLFRWIFHDWSDKYGVKILRALIPALKKGAKIVISDICIPEVGQLPITADRNLRIMDISMKAFNNARERDPEAWATLFAEADPRFRLMSISVPQQARMAIILAEWDGE